MTGPSAEALMGALYSARFFRAHPCIDAAMRARLQGAAAGGCLATFFLWGVNEKAALDACDIRTMTHLAALLERIDATLHCRTTFTIVVCDSHGALNCADAATACAYAAAVAEEAAGRGWHVLAMSALWRDAGLSLDRVDQLAGTLDVAAALPRLERFAALHYRGVDAHTGARRYLAARLLEKPLLTRHFAQAIHLTPTEPALALVQPSLPTFYIWTERKGCSAKPWFARKAA